MWNVSVGQTTGLSAIDVNRSLNVLDAALNYWGRYIDFGTANIDVKIEFIELDDTVIAQAGSTFRQTGGSLFQADSIIELQTGVDPNGGAEEIFIEVNTLGYELDAFHFGGLNSPPPADKLDLFTVLLHEIAHGFGFLSLFDRPESTVFDSFVVGAPGSGLRFDGPITSASFGLIDLTSPDPSHVLNSNSLLSEELNLGDRQFITAREMWMMRDIGLPFLLPTEGNDRLYGLIGQPSISLLGGNDNFVAAGGEEVFGGDGADTITGGGVFHGESGNDLLIGGGTLSGGLDNDTIDGGDQNDFIDGGDGDDDIDAREGNDFIDAGAGNDIAGGGDGDDDVRGGEGQDTLAGRAGNDTLLGENGDDELNGGDGDDLLNGGNGADTLIGGEGRDIVSYQFVGGAVSINLMTGIASGGGGEIDGDMLSEIEIIFGSQFDDVLIGDAEDNLLNGSSGNDTIEGGGGRDNINGENGNDQILGGDGADRLVGGSGDDAIEGGDDNDLIDGAFGNDMLVGDAGDDTLLGENGDDQLFAGFGDDRANGGNGADFIRTGPGKDTLLGGADNDTLGASNRSDLLRGGDGDDLLLGSNGNDRLFGDGGNDTLLGGNGRDTLEGGTGADRLVGGNSGGADVASYAGAGAGVQVRLWNGDGTAGDAAGDALLEIENLAGSSHDDTLTGDANANRIDGNGGDDIIQGLDGDDQLIGDRGDDLLVGGAGNDTFLYFAGDGADVITDFQAGAGSDDAIRLFNLGPAFDTFAEVLAATSDVGGDAVIDFGGGDQITLQGVTTANLHQDDFVFG